MRTQLLTVLALAFVGLSVADANAKKVFVSIDGNSIAPYTNWTDAATDVQAALSVCQDGDSLIVSNGTYTIAREIHITNAVHVLSVTGPEATTIAGSHPASTSRCIRVSNAQAVIEGLTFSNGKTPSHLPRLEQIGGAVMLEAGKLVECAVLQSSAFYGGGIWCGSGVTVSNCTVMGCRADSEGGGIYLGGVGCRVQSSTVVSNQAAAQGGGIVLGHDSTLADCKVMWNSAGIASGGGILCRGRGTVERCSISHNSSDYAAGIACGPDAVVRQCTILNNIAGQSAGGVGLWKGGTIWSSLIASNRAASGAGVSFAGSGGKVFGCTIAGNAASSEGGGISPTLDEMQNSTPQADVVGSIVQDNTAPTHQNWGSSNSQLSISFSLSTPLPPGTGNISTQPDFVDASAGDYRLSPTSPCIDTGTNLSSSVTDLMGIGRPLDGDNDGTATTDMGAYEYVHPSADSDGDGLRDARELHADTDPTDAKSVLRITGASLSLTNISITWKGGRSVKQVVETSNDLSQTNWVPIHTEHPPTMITNSVNTTASNPAVYYRIRVEP